MKIRRTTRKAKYTLSQILNNDFFKWLDGYLKRLESEVSPVPEDPTWYKNRCFTAMDKAEACELIRKEMRHA